MAYGDALRTYYTLSAHEAEVRRRNGPISATELGELNEIRRQLAEPIRQLLGEKVHQRMQALIGEGLYYDMVNQSLDPTMVAAGVPLRGVQAELLAKIFYEEIGTKGGVGIGRYGSADVNEQTGLRPSDEALLQRAITILSP